MRDGGEKTTFTTLNGMRGIAAIAVVNAHLQGYFAGYHSVHVGLVVDFFFVLSGFVLAHAYEPRLLAGLGAGRFMAARLLRLYPLYLIGLLIGATVLWFNWNWAGPTKFAVTLGAGLLMLPPPPSLSANAYNLFPLNFPAWSLLFELIANLAYALVVRRLSDRVLAILIAAAFVGLVAVGLGVGTLDQGVRPQQFAGGLARVMVSFFMGVALHRLWRRRPLGLSVPPVVLFGLLVLPLLATFKGPALWIYDLGVIAVYYPILVLLGAQSRGSATTTWISGVLGAASYPLYVLHVPLWDGLRASVDPVLTQAAPWSGVAVVVAFVLISLALEAWVDLPLRRRFKRRLAPGAAVAPPAAMSPDGP